MESTTTLEPEGSHRYGIVLAIALAAVAFLIIAPESSWSRAAAVVFALWGSAATAEPASEAVEGHLLEIDGNGLIVDLAGASGASDGDVLELWRPLSLRHTAPRTASPSNVWAGICV